MNIEIDRLHKWHVILTMALEATENAETGNDINTVLLELDDLIEGVPLVPVTMEPASNSLRFA